MVIDIGDEYDDGDGYFWLVPLPIMLCMQVSHHHEDDDNGDWQGGEYDGDGDFLLVAIPFILWIQVMLLLFRDDQYQHQYDQ